MSAPDSKPKRPRRTLVGIVQESAARARERRDNPGPQPWIVLKLAVFITSGIIAYASYVYIGRLCVPMIKRHSNALGSRALGITFLSIFCPLIIMIVWSYYKICFTPPGFARDHVSQSEQPRFNPAPSWASYVDPQEPDDVFQSRSYESMGAPAPLSSTHHDAPTAVAYSTSGHSHAGPPHWPPVHVQPAPSPTSPEDATLRDSYVTRDSTLADPRHSHARTHSYHSQSQVPPKSPQKLNPVHDPSHIPDAARDDPNAGVLDTIVQPPAQSDRAPSPVQFSPSLRDAEGGLTVPPPAARGTRARTQSILQIIAAPFALPHQTATALQQGTKEKRNGIAISFTRRPPTTPVLLPEHRYCRRDKIVKPRRTHHCRLCGTCVLRYDHHCPWIGQCVGARNHRFFVIFLVWGLLYCLWILTTLLALVARSASRNSDDIDPQHIVIIALAGLFSLFTSTLLATHIRFILLNATTVESLYDADIRERESEGLSGIFQFWQCRAKRRVRKQWDDEWGRIGREGNLWWLGDPRLNWESVMGPRKLLWLLPLGGPISDGLNYETNPRFDPQGRWRPRREWPPHLQ